MIRKDREKKAETQTPEEVKLKGYLDIIAPSVIQFTQTTIFAATPTVVCGRSENILPLRTNRQFCAI